MVGIELWVGLPNCSIVPIPIPGSIPIPDSDSDSDSDSVETRCNVSLRLRIRLRIRIPIQLRIRKWGRKRIRGQLNNLGNPQKIQFQPLYDYSNQPQQNKSTQLRGDTLQHVSTTRQYIINNPKQWQEGNLNKFL